jgi:hypothetical protein
MPFHALPCHAQPLPLEDRIEMSREAVGLATWEELGAQEQDRLVAQCIWKPEVLQAWAADREAEEQKRLIKLMRNGKLPPSASVTSSSSSGDLRLKGGRKGRAVGADRDDVSGEE